MNSNLLKEILKFNDFTDHLRIGLANKKLRDISDQINNEKWQEKLNKATYGETNFFKIFTETEMQYILNDEKINEGKQENISLLNWREVYLRGISTTKRFENIFSQSNNLKAEEKSWFSAFFNYDQEEINNFEYDLSALSEFVNCMFRDYYPEVPPLSKKNEYFYRDINSFHQNFILNKTDCFKAKSAQMFDEIKFLYFSNFKKFTTQFFEEFAQHNHNNVFVHTFLKLRFYNDDIYEDDLFIIKRNPILYILYCLQEKIKFMTYYLKLKIEGLLIKAQADDAININKHSYSEYFFLDSFIAYSKNFCLAIIEMNEQLEILNFMVNDIFRFITSNMSIDLQDNEIPDFSIYRMMIYIWNKNIAVPLKAKLISSSAKICENYLYNSFANFTNVQESESLVQNRHHEERSTNSPNSAASYYSIFTKKSIAENSDDSLFLSKDIKSPSSNLFDINFRNDFKALCNDLGYKDDHNHSVKNFQVNLLSNSEYLLLNIFSIIISSDICENNVYNISSLNFRVSEAYAQLEDALLEVIEKFIKDKVLCEEGVTMNSKSNLISDILVFFSENTFFTEKLFTRTVYRIKNKVSNMIYPSSENYLMLDINNYFTYNKNLLLANYNKKLADSFSQENKKLSCNSKGFFAYIDLFGFNFENLFQTLVDNMKQKYFTNQSHKNHAYIESRFIKLKEFNSRLENQSKIIYEKSFTLVNNIINSNLLIKQELLDMFLKYFENFTAQDSEAQLDQYLLNYCSYVVFCFYQNLKFNKNFKLIEDVINFYVSTIDMSEEHKAYIMKLQTKNFSFNRYIENAKTNKNCPIKTCFEAYSFFNDFYLAESIGISSANFKFASSNIESQSRFDFILKDDYLAFDNIKIKEKSSDCRLSVASTLVSEDLNMHENQDILMEIEN